MYIGLHHTHNLLVILFLLIYLIKAILLLTNKKERLLQFAAKSKIPEMVITILFLATGITMLWMKGSATAFLVFKIVALIAAIPLAIVGFKKSNKILVVISLLLLLVIYGLGELNKNRSPKIDINSGVIKDPENPAYNITQHGAALFQANCAVCHGKDGKGANGIMGLSDSKLDNLSKQKVITDGRKVMPSFKTVLNEVEIKALITHLETIKN